MASVHDEDVVMKSSSYDTTSSPLPGYRTIGDLPNELLIKIFEYTDSPAPSTSHEKLLLEPKPNLTSSKNTPLKNISLVSPRWRGTALPLLFRNIQVKIHEFEWSSGSIARRLQDFFDFIVKRHLAKSVVSFTLCCLSKRLPEICGEASWAYLARFWQKLFGVLDPDAVLIIASVEFLSYLTGCSIRTRDRECFESSCQYLQLTRKARGSRENLSKMMASSVDDSGELNGEPGASESTSKEPMDSVKESPANDVTTVTPNCSCQSSHSSSIHGSQGCTFREKVPSCADAPNLFSRPWTKLLLNEGSYLKVYTRPDFWDRETPSILNELLTSSKAFVDVKTTIRDLEYIAIFPLESLFSDIMNSFPRVDRLYVQLVPRDDVLNNSVRMTNVDAEELWMERNRCYALLMRELFNAPPLGNFKHLQYFESGDAADVDAWSMAVEYVKRAGNGWKVAGEGVFERDTEDLKPEPDMVPEGEGSAFEGALIRWAWNGTMKLPVTARPFYDRPLGPAGL